MKKKKGLMEYVDEYIANCKIRSEAMVNGDYATYNKAYSLNGMIYKIVKKSGQTEKFYMKVLNTTNNGVALSGSCAQMWRLNIQSKINGSVTVQSL